MHALKKVAAIVFIASIVAMYGLPHSANASEPTVSDLYQQPAENDESASEETTTQNDVENDGSIDALPGTEEVASDNESLVFDALRAFLALAAVIALLYLILMLVKKRQSALQAKGGLQSISGLPLGQQRSIQVVKAGSKILVVGVGQQVELLAEINDPEDIRFFMEQQEGSEDESFTASFTTKLEKLKQQRKQMSSSWKKNNGDSK
ncbi:flagellar biosynthetic protein FliO [Aureibacillus halotolerans]|uniref:flagellar biosynthetic protein FliO n=1 Tax=Aureibacillus halotolerans TaxID=1508390 RepID=UPI001414D959|nr:flagellar biosynthetic protein FliO [Aureibacillus halotolerans]